jgi:hypothetical protein
MSVKSIAKSAIKTYIADTPLWAKIIRFAGLIASAAGETIASSPDLWSPGLVDAAPYMLRGGIFIALVVQSFKK